MSFRDGFCHKKKTILQMVLKKIIARLLTEYPAALLEAQLKKYGLLFIIIMSFKQTNKRPVHRGNAKVFWYIYMRRKGVFLGYIYISYLAANQPAQIYQ